MLRTSSRHHPFRKSPCRTLRELIGDSKFLRGGARVGALLGLEVIKLRISATWVEDPEGPQTPSRHHPFRKSPCRTLRVLIGDSKFLRGGARVGALLGVGSHEAADVVHVGRRPRGAALGSGPTPKTREGPEARTPGLLPPALPLAMPGPAARDRHGDSSSARAIRAGIGPAPRPRARAARGRARWHRHAGHYRQARAGADARSHSEARWKRSFLLKPGDARAERLHGAVTSNKPDLT